jgi:hypothetical protein
VRQERLKKGKPGNTGWVRALDHLREQTVAALRERALDGCLTLDTFAQRVAAAYRAKTEEELADLLADLPSNGKTLLRRGRIALAKLWRRPEPPKPAVEIEVLMPRSAEALTLGRSQACDVVVGEETVSRFHAELRHGDGDEWTIRDLESTNGTWLNGTRIREARIFRGDVLRLGGLRLDLRL